ncbi:MAG: acetyl-CoA carboxylase biotin carboxylase subunit [Bacteroidia bacterium]
MKPIRKLLIANRGEIALRVLRTAKRMGIACVAIYSEADRYAPYVDAADEKYLLPGNLPRDTYLNIPLILSIAKHAQVDAIHPGYGFLSENPVFAQAVEKEGILFIGPKAEAMRLLGNKIQAKKLAQQVGVPLASGTLEPLPTDSRALEIAQNVGFPLLIKAAAGGGGKGMRKVDTLEDFLLALERAQSEALSAFGDDKVFIEKYISRPRHIEIQVFRDTHGDALYLFERECSIQRRHQKILEEAPSPFLDPVTRENMGQAALRLVNAANYTNAATVEFLVDDQKNFYFLEVNTRLQVEHPVTEAITGLDLVEWQIRIAEGEKLPLRQSEIPLQGHAIEARLYAEDPKNNFFPSSGRLKYYALPEEKNLRIDNGYYSGQEVTLFYDPMLAKIIAWGNTRREAIALLQKSLFQTHVVGVETSLPFLRWLLAHPAFEQGETHTHFIDTYFNPSMLDVPLTPEELSAAEAVVKYLMTYKYRPSAISPGHQAS